MPGDEHLQLIREFVVVDTETTGFSSVEDHLVEVAALRFIDGRPLTTFTTLVRPPVSIGPKSAKVHHLTDRIVEHAPMWFEVREQFRSFVGEALVVAHNASFDAGFLAGDLSKNRWVCSYRLARHLWPELDEFNNGFLWYALGLERLAPQRLAPHSARDDAFMTGHIFLEECSAFVREGLGRNVDDLLQFAADPYPVLKMPFGKHKGHALEEVPTDYLEWFVRASTSADRSNGFRDDPDLLAAIRRELFRRSAPFCGVNVA